MGTYVLSEMRGLTDEIDRVLARELGYEGLLPSLEHAYYSAYKPTGARSGTRRYDPSKAKGRRPIVQVKLRNLVPAVALKTPRRKRSVVVEPGPPVSGRSGHAPAA